VTGYTSDLGRSIVDVSVDESLSFISRNYCSQSHIRANAPTFIALDWRHILHWA